MFYSSVLSNSNCYCHCNSTEFKLNRKFKIMIQRSLQDWDWWTELKLKTILISNQTDVNNEEMNGLRHITTNCTSTLTLQQLLTGQTLKVLYSFCCSFCSFFADMEKYGRWWFVLLVRLAPFVTRGWGKVVSNLSQIYRVAINI